MTVPESLEVVIMAGDRPIEGLFVFLRFEMSRKNPFDLLFGPSGDEGKIAITRSEVLEEARKSMELFVTDYADLETYWTGKLRATPLNRKAVASALSAYSLFRLFKYPPGYEQALKAADAALARIPNAKLHAVVHCETTGLIQVESQPVLSS